jgi:aspartyl-tRNA(Asn)/glutamyl-tRNA(Gln) amidotransferase subunit A
MTAHELIKKIKNREMSSEEITVSILNRIKETGGNINAFVTVMGELAVKQAKEVDSKIKEGKPVGMLAGIPILIKDNINIKGTRTTCSSKILNDFVSPYDATVVKKIRSADAIFIGKSNMDEFAMGSSTETSHFSVTKNPWDIARIPGGSSGGSAAAVAAGQAVLSIGSDTGGSIRQPASLCGVVGLKPTYGRVSRYGLVAFASSLDQIGPITKDTTDAALLMNVISGYDDNDSTSVNLPVPDYTKALINNVRNIKIGIPKEYFSQGLDNDVKTAVMEAVKLLKSMGAQVKELSLPHTEYAVAAYYIIAPSEASSNLARYDGVKYGYRANEEGEGVSLIDVYERTRGEGFGQEVKRRIMLGTYSLSSGYYDAYYLKAQKVRTLIKQDFDKAFGEVDVIITPTAPTTAFKIGEKTEDPLKMYLSDIYTISANLAGIPGISIPCGFDKEGLPIGLQLLAKPFGEETIFRTAYSYEQNTGWHLKEPKI